MLGMLIKGKLQFVAVQVDSECLIEAVNSLQNIQNTFASVSMTWSGQLC